MAAFLEKAIERYRRQKFLEDANASYAAFSGSGDQMAFFSVLLK
jgi:hypothetical protein